jgi:sorting nexin-13
MEKIHLKAVYQLIHYCFYVCSVFSYMNELIVYLLNNNDTSNVGGNTNISNTGTVMIVHDRSPYKGSSQGSQEESRNLTVAPSGLVPGNTSSMRTFVTSEGGKTKVSEDDHDSAIKPRPEWAVVLDAATKRRSQVLAPENLENMWAIGRNYQKKMNKADHSSRLKGSGGDNSPSAGAVGKELSSNFNERIASVDDKYMVNLMQSTNRNVQSAFVTGSHPLALQNKNEMKPKEMNRVNYSSKEKAHETSNSAKAELKRSSSTPDIEKRYLVKSNQPMVSSESGNARKNQDEKVAGLASHGEVLLHAPKIRCRVIFLTLLRELTLVSFFLFTVIMFLGFTKKIYHSVCKAYVNLKWLN